MSAQVIPLAACRRMAPAAGARQPEPQPPFRHFASFDEVMGFALPDPTWVSQDKRECEFSPVDAERVREFFRWFGLSVDTSRAPQSLAEGWEYLGSELGAPAEYLQTHPRTFKALCGRWSQEQRDYLDVVIQGDWGAARALVRRTPIWFSVQQKMRTPEGCALNETFDQ